jgi:DNA-binding response OmpR family regulator
MPEGRILVVEDDPTILTALCEKLSMEGYEVRCAEDGEAARRVLLDHAFDLLVLDLMIPRIDGLTLLRWLRKRTTDLPVLIVSARGSEAEKVEGLRAGADDYLAKPFGVRELLARIEALLRRIHGPSRTLGFGDVKIDFRDRRVFRGRKEVALSPKELQVLLHLARHHDRAVSREELQTAVWGYFASSGDRAVDFHILNLRRKLERDPAEPRHILTRHGRGYQLSV